MKKLKYNGRQDRSHDSKGVGVVVGLLRLILAVAVIISHSQHDLFGITFMSGIQAVEVFFILSGFYMAFILTEKYHSYKLFITNRFLRLYPTYFIVLFVTVAGAMLAAFFSGGASSGALKPYIDSWSHLGWGSLIIIIVTNIVIFGQDLIVISSLKPDGTFTFAQTPGSIGAWPLVILTHAWSIGVELVFYLLAPFVIRLKTWTISVLATVSIGSVLVIQYNEFLGLQWLERVSPFQFGYFLLGVLAFRAYVRVQSSSISIVVCRWISYVIILVTIAYQFIPLPAVIRLWAYFGIVTCALPFMFSYAKNAKFDRLIGELSYPIYIVHALTRDMFIKVFEAFNVPVQSSWFTAGTILLSIATAYALYRMIIVPIDRIRRARIERAVPAAMT